MESLKVIRNSPELMQMVKEINYENEKPRSKRRSKACLAVDKFWSGSGASMFRWQLEKEGHASLRHVKMAITLLVLERSGRWNDRSSEG